MGSTAFTQRDVASTVEIMYKCSEIVVNRGTLCLALGISMSQLKDITRCRLAESETRVFLTQVLHIWISKSTEPTFEKLDGVLRNLEFNSTADEILEKQTELRAVSTHDFEEYSPAPSSAIWFGVPADVHVFTGRVEYMEKLHESIVGQNEVNAANDMTVITAVCGIGGVGKTSLTIRYAWMFVKIFYVNVVWINSESVNTITNSFKRLARELGQNTSAELCEVVSGIYKYFGNSKTLIVFDNVESYVDIKSYLPNRSPNALRPYVLLSSRKRDWHLRTHLIDLNLFEVEESVEFFRVYLSLKSEQELDFAEKISTGLQNLPLAIRQAGAYIKVQQKERNTSMVHEMKSYLEAFNVNSNVLKFEHWEHEPDIYEKTVYSTWTVNMKQLRKLNSLTETIIEFISYLNSENIPVKLLYNIQRRGLWKRLTNPVIEPSEVDSAIKLLSSFSLITKQTDELDTISVHRLLQKVVRDQIQSKCKGSQFNWIISWIRRSLRLDNYDEYTDMFIIHSLAVKKHVPTSLLEKKMIQSFLELIVSKQNNSIDQRVELLMDMLRQKKYEEMVELYEKSKAIYTSTGSGTKNNTNDLFVLRLLKRLCVEVQRHYKLTQNCEKVLKCCQIIKDILEGFHISFYDECIQESKILHESAEEFYNILIRSDDLSIITVKTEVISTVHCIFNVLFERLRASQSNTCGSVTAELPYICLIMIKFLGQVCHKKEIEFNQNTELGLDVQQRKELCNRLGVSIMCLVLRVEKYSLHSNRTIHVANEAVDFYGSLSIRVFVENEKTVFDIINLLAELGSGEEILELICYVEELIRIDSTTLKDPLINMAACLYNNSHHNNIVDFREEMLRKSLHFYRECINKVSENCLLVTQCAVGIINCLVELNRPSEIIESLSEVTDIIKAYCRALPKPNREYLEFEAVPEILLTTGMQCKSTESANIKIELILHSLCLYNIQYEFEMRTLWFSNALRTVTKMIDTYLELDRIDDILNLSSDFHRTMQDYDDDLVETEMAGLCDILLEKGRNTKQTIRHPALITECLKISKKCDTRTTKDGVDKSTLAFRYYIATCEFLLERNLDRLTEHSYYIYRIAKNSNDEIKRDHLKMLAKVAVELRQVGQFNTALDYFEYLRKFYFAEGNSLLFEQAGWTKDIASLGVVIRDDACFVKAMSVLPGVSLIGSHDFDSLLTD